MNLVIKENSEKKYNIKKTKKVSIIGLGFVGSSIAYALMIKEIADEIIFIDLKKDIINAQMLDIKHGLCKMSKTKIKQGTYEDISNSDLIIICAGRNRKENETRLDLINDNLKIADEIIKNIEKAYKEGVILIVSNPVDIITYYFAKKLNKNKNKIIGTGCILDNSRLINFLASYLKVKTDDIEAYTIGEHGSNLVILWSNLKIKNIPIEEYCKKEKIPFDCNIKNKIEEKIKNMGSKIISIKGQTHFGISTCVCYLANAILNNEKINSCICTLFNKNYALSVPCIIDKNGVKEIINLKMSKDEKEKFEQICTNYSSITEKIRI